MKEDAGGSSFALLNYRVQALQKSTFCPEKGKKEGIKIRDRRTECEKEARGLRSRDLQTIPAGQAVQTR